MEYLRELDILYRLFPLTTTLEYVWYYVYFEDHEMATQRG